MNNNNMNEDVMSIVTEGWEVGQDEDNDVPSLYKNLYLLFLCSY